MADVPTGAVPAPTTPAAPAPSQDKFAVAKATKAAKLAEVNRGLTKLASEQTTAPAASTSEAPSPTEPPVSPQPAPTIDEKAEKPVEAKLNTEPEKTDEEPVDPKTAKALAQIDKQAARFREEQKKAKAELEVERAEIARMRAEAQAFAKSLDDLRGLAKKDPIALLEKMGIQSEDEWEVVGRSAFPRTKAGKADPNAAKVAAQTARERELMQQLEDLKKTTEELRNEFKQRDQQATTQQFIQRWQDEAVKAIPADKPTLIAKLHEKSPQKARQALLEIGARLERENDNETPSHAEVIAEYERMRRAELEEQGVDVDALLRPAKAAAPAKPPPKTLDPTAVNGVRPINTNPSKDEKIRTLSKDLSRLWAQDT